MSVIRFSSAVAAVILGMVFLASPAIAEEPSKLTSDKDIINYAIGASTIKNFKLFATDADIDLNMIIKGMQDACSGKKMLLEDDEIRAVMHKAQVEIMMRNKITRAVATMPSLTAADAKVSKP